MITDPAGTPRRSGPFPGPIAGRGFRCWMTISLPRELPSPTTVAPSSQAHMPSRRTSAHRHWRTRRREQRYSRSGKLRLPEKVFHGVPGPLPYTPLPGKRISASGSNLLISPTLTPSSSAIAAAIFQVCPPFESANTAIPSREFVYQNPDLRPPDTLRQRSKFVRV